MLTSFIKLVDGPSLAGNPTEAPEAAPRVMTLETLLRLLEEVRKVRRGGATLVWCGGELTSLGLPFFAEAVRLADATLGKSSVVHHLHTRGSSLDGDWANFLKARRVLVTLRLDGPEELHEAHHVTAYGPGSHRAARRALRLLKSRDVTLRVLCLLSSLSVPSADALLGYFATIGVPEVEFVPLLQSGGNSPVPAIQAREYGSVMTRVFEDWSERKGAPRVNLFLGLERRLAGRQSTVCRLEGRCARYITFECDGNVYPCEEFAGVSEYYLGNVREENLLSMLRGPRARNCWKSWQTIPRACRSCRWQSLCRGGCPLERWRAGNGEQEPSLLCEGLKMLYEHMAEVAAKA
ncbi:MAG: SPASM domain-containing protein [Armatimonadetes bacterium]|nr:SPASM domain-containing protein [Armatimonadota bacterium]